MINTKNIIMIASITAVLGFGIAAFQTNTITVDALMDNTSEILDIGEKSEITTLGKPTGDKGGKKSSSLAGEATSADGDTTVKCSASNILKCTIKNSGVGLIGVKLNTSDGTFCAISDVSNGSSRASIDTRKAPEVCDYQPSMTYNLIVYLNSFPLGEEIEFMVSFPDNSLVITEVPKIG